MFYNKLRLYKYYVDERGRKCVSFITIDGTSRYAVNVAEHLPITCEKLDKIKLKDLQTDDLLEITKEAADYFNGVGAAASKIFGSW